MLHEIVILALHIEQLQAVVALPVSSMFIILDTN